MGRSHKHQKRLRKERAAAKTDKPLSKEEIVIRKMKAVYSKYGKINKVKENENDRFL